MTYDFHLPDEGKTGENSPLYASAEDQDKNKNCDASISAWLNSGANPAKLALGIPFYGHVFSLEDSEQHGIGALTSDTEIDNSYIEYNEVKYSILFTKLRIFVKKL